MISRPYKLALATTYGFTFNPNGAPIKGTPISKNPNIVTTPSAKDNLLQRKDLKSGESPTFGDISKGDPNLPFMKDSSGTPVFSKSSQGCENCRYGDIQCEVMKVGCELQGATADALGDFGEYAVPILIGAGAIVLIILLRR